jgi:hypothetical protein
MAERKGMKHRVGRRSSRALVIMAAGAVLASALAAAPTRAAEPSGPEDCPDIFPVDQVVGGMDATGWTATGNTAGVEKVKSFPVEVLDVLEDGIAPNRDLIVIKARGPLFQDAGIWAGMSGSPVYHDGDLLGAIAYGFSYGASRIGGVTPAEDMVDIPSGSSSTETASAEVELSRTERERIARAAGTSTASVDNEFVQLKTPLGVAGLSPRAARKFKQVVKEEALPVIPHIAGKTSALGGSPSGLPTTGTPPSAGESFAGALSFGDVTFAGIGTTTMVCDDRALAFGHPFFWSGETHLGAGTATAITVVPDDTWGSYKLANVGAAFGTVDQDRLAGISAVVGNMPEVALITSEIDDIDDEDPSESFETYAVEHEYMPFITFLHNLSTSDVVVDRIGEGSSYTNWTLSGTRADGSPWSVSRTNRFASQWDITYSSIYEIENALYKILGQDFEDVTVDNVDFNADYEKTVKQYRVKEGMVSRNGGEFRKTRKIGALPGDVLRFRVTLADLQGGMHFETTKFVVPKKFRRAYLFASSGEWERGSIDCFTEQDDCYQGGTETKFDKLLAKIANAPKNNDLLMSLRVGRKSERVIRTQDQVVDGYEYIRIVRKDGDGDGFEEGVSKG